MTLPYRMRATMPATLSVGPAVAYEYDNSENGPRAARANSSSCRSRTQNRRRRERASGATTLECDVRFAVVCGTKSYIGAVSSDGAVH